MEFEWPAYCYLLVTNCNHTMKRGFTLIELLVVIAIIGILSAVVLTSLSSARTDALDAQQVSTLQNVALAYQIEQDNLGNYPAFASLSTINTGSIGTTSTSVPTAAGTIYLQDVDAGDAYCLSVELRNGDTGATHYVVDEDGSRYGTAHCS